jgi:quercetin dioxygenase-like cupin family protein
MGGSGKHLGDVAFYVADGEVELGKGELEHELEQCGEFRYEKSPVQDRAFF